PHCECAGHRRMSARRESEFNPSRLLRNPHVQSVLASSSLRRLLLRRRARAVERGARTMMLDGGDGVRLLGFHTAQRALPAPRGLAVMFHGWEGSARSTYLLQTGGRLLAEGWDVFRLNFRDHGGTHDLNRGIFHSCLIDEVAATVGDIASRFPQQPLALIGYSLGGNFALRVGLRAPALGIPLSRVLAVCPVVSPHRGLAAIESSRWFYHAYFMHKWRLSLKRKQRAFPGEQLFERRQLHGSLRELTRALVLRHTDFGSLDNYLDGYSIAGDQLASLQVPASILTSRDDPVIPVGDFERLQLPPCAELTIVEHGGHCGFIRDLGMSSFAEDFIVDRLSRLERTA
ncbi:MAG: YheT family hydrolase, partial [Rhodanobacteraceae bacterium]